MFGRTAPRVHKLFISAVHSDSGDTLECKKEENAVDCTCTYPCSKRGMCCDCVASHRARGELPGCFFPPEVEKTYDRSIERFVAIYK